MSACSLVGRSESSPRLALSLARLVGQTVARVWPPLATPRRRSSPPHRDLLLLRGKRSLGSRARKGAESVRRYSGQKEPSGGAFSPSGRALYPAHRRKRVPGAIWELSARDKDKALPYGALSSPKEREPRREGPRASYSGSPWCVKEQSSRVLKAPVDQLQQSTISLTESEPMRLT